MVANSPSPRRTIVGHFKEVTTMIDFPTAKILSHRRNIQRYARLLATELTELERQYLHKRIAEEQAALEQLQASPRRPLRRARASDLTPRASTPVCWLGPIGRGAPRGALDRGSSLPAGGATCRNNLEQAGAFPTGAASWHAAGWLFLGVQSREAGRRSPPIAYGCNRPRLCPDSVSRGP